MIRDLFQNRVQWGCSGIPPFVHALLKIDMEYGTQAVTTLSKLDSIWKIDSFYRAQNTRLGSSNIFS